LSAIPELRLALARSYYVRGLHWSPEAFDRRQQASL
jgi:hypothetical protein